MKNSRLLTLSLAGLAFLLLGTPGALAKGQTADQAFEQMLRGIDTVPTRKSMQKRWPNVVQRLISAANEHARDNYTRSRAISFLSFFAEAKNVRPSLEQLITDKKARIRGISVYTLARTFGDPGDTALVDSIEASVKDSVRDVKTFAIRSLRWVRHPSAVKSLERIAKTAPEKSLRTLANRTLKKRRF